MTNRSLPGSVKTIQPRHTRSMYNYFRETMRAAIGLVIIGQISAVHAQDTGNAKTNAPTKLPEVVITAEREEQQPQNLDLYSVPPTVTAIKGGTSLLVTPQAISIVPQSLLQDQRVRRLEDALRNVAGITPGGYYADWDYYRIRGFDSSFTTYWDGLPGDNGKNVEMFGAERVDVVKGPASALYGQGPLGGMVNVVSKRPLPETFLDTEFTGGSYGFYEPSVDMGTALNADKTVYGRLTAVYRDQESFVDYVHKHRFFIAPALTWEISPDTTLTFLSQFVYDWDQLAMPLPAQGTVLPNINGEIPISRYVGEPDSNKVEQWRARIGYELNHQFNDTLSLRQNFSYSRLGQDWTDIMYPAVLDPNQRTLYRYPYGYQAQLDRFAVDTALTAKFETGSLQHHLMGGVDFLLNNTESTSEQINYANFPADYPALDLYNPVYGTPLPAYATSTTSTSKSDQTGLYVQNQVKLNEKWILTAGGRFDWTSSGNNSQTAAVPRAGLAYEFTPGATVYANYSQSFNPQWFSTDAAGNPVDPETGENFELGLKTSLMEGRLQTLLAIYHLTRQNVATADLSTPNPNDSIASGEQRSRGLELEAAYELAPGWNLTGAYSYIDAKITEDNTLPVGSRLQGVAEHNFSAWMKYTLQYGKLKGLGFGLGGRYYTDQEGDATYTAPFKLPAYGLMDAAIYYRRDRLRAQVNINNLLNERYFTGSYNNLYVLPGEPITVRASLSWSF